MKNKMFKKVLAVAISLSLCVPAAISADISDTMYVGDIASISASDIAVNSNYESLDAVSNDYAEARSNATTSSTSINSGQGLGTGSDGSILNGGSGSGSGTGSDGSSLNGGSDSGSGTGNGSGSSSGLSLDINSGLTSDNGSSGISSGSTDLTGASTVMDLINDLISNFDANNLWNNIPYIKNPNMTADEIEDLIKQQKAKIQEKYEAEKEKAIEAYRKGTEEGAEIIEQAIKDAMNGINPVTGDKLITNADEDIGEVVDAEDTDIDYGAAVEAARLATQLKYIRSGDHNIVQWKRLDESDYIDDELVLDDAVYSGIAGVSGYKLISYKCAKCGKEYSSQTACDCGKFLLNYVYDYAENNGYFGGVTGFSSFNKDGTVSNNSLFGSKVECGLCGKKLTVESFDFKGGNRFYYGSDGAWKCADCQENYGSSDLNTYDGVTLTLEDTSKWASTFFVFQTGYAYFDNVVIPVIIDPDYLTVDEGGNTSDAYKAAMEEYYAADASIDTDLFTEEELENFRKAAEALDTGADTDTDTDTDSEDSSDSGGGSGSDAGDGSDTSSENGNGSDDGNGSDSQNGADSNTDGGNGTGTENGDGSNTEDGSNDDGAAAIKDTDAYNDPINTIFKEWSADQNDWTEEQKKLYEEFKSKYESDTDIQNTLQELIDNGIIAKDKSMNDILAGIADYIAGFTSINDSVTVSLMVDAASDAVQVDSYSGQAQGDVKVSIYAPNGSSVATDQIITSSFAYRFMLDQAGTYTIKRTVQVYNVTWELYTQQYAVQAVLEFPDGSTEVLASKTVTRIREDLSGMTTSNVRNVSVSDIKFKVTERELDIDKKDFYDTERIS